MAPSLTPEPWRGGKGTVPFAAETLAAFIKEASLKYGVAIEGDYDLGTIFSNIPAALAFYKTAEDRNSAILANTINKMQKEGQSVAALVTGGYHTKGLTKILRGILKRMQKGGPRRGKRRRS